MLLASKFCVLSWSGATRQLDIKNLKVNRWRKEAVEMVREVIERNKLQKQPQFRQVCAEIRQIDENSVRLRMRPYTVL